MTTKDRRLILYAINLAIEWEGSVIDSLSTCGTKDKGYNQTRQEAKDSIRELELLKVRIIGKKMPYKVLVKGSIVN